MKDRPKAVKAILVFGEDENDRESIRQLFLALRGEESVVVRKVRKPIVLIKGQSEAAARKNAIDIARQFKAENVRHEVRLVLAHRDCDAVEPAHTRLIQNIEGALRQRITDKNVTVIAVVPAWEMEAWFFLWPAAAVAVNAKWSRPAKSGRDVGLIVDAKEAFRAALRPRTGSGKVRDYEESDAPRIAAKVRELGLIAAKDAISKSFDDFEAKVKKCVL